MASRLLLVKHSWTLRFYMQVHFAVKGGARLLYLPPMEKLICATCFKPKATLSCGVCVEPLCKYCAQFLQEDSFKFSTQQSIEIKHDTFCGPCFDARIAPRLEI